MENKPPEKEFRAGQIKASLWENEKQNDKGETVKYYSVKIEKSYKDKAGQWQTSNSYFREDLPRLRIVIDKALDYIYFHSAEEPQF